MATDLARVTREALGHHVEACFEARFPQEGARQGRSDQQEFINKAAQELQESRIMRGRRRLRLWLPIQARMVGCTSASTYQGSIRSPRPSASSPHKWGGAKDHPTAMFACLM